MNGIIDLYKTNKIFRYGTWAVGACIVLGTLYSLFS